jgi:hypothetical protein
MAWTVTLRAEDGTPSRQMPVALVALELVLVDLKRDEYPFLTGIDPYGLTMFNARQAVGLVNELRRLRPRTHELSDQHNSEMSAFEELAEACRDSERQYLWLEGD